MLIQLSPHPAQVRFHAEAALGAFETLGDEAIPAAKSHLIDLIHYLELLNSADYTSPVSFVAGVEARIGLKGDVG